MATKKLDMELVVRELEKGSTPANLALKYGVHPSTIRRYARQAGISKTRISHEVHLNSRVKLELRKILASFNVKGNLDIIVSELDKNFEIEIREQEEEFPILNL